MFIAVFLGLLALSQADSAVEYQMAGVAGPTIEQQIGAIILIVLTFVIAYLFSRRKKA